MSTYNTKNYTEQGGETTHFGGTVVFDDKYISSGFVVEHCSAECGFNFLK